MTVLHHATIRKLMKEAGAGRVSEGAVNKFAEVMEEAAYEFIPAAAKLAHSAGRKTVRSEDILFLRRARLFREVMKEAKEDAEENTAE